MGPCLLWGCLDKSRHIVPTALSQNAMLLERSVQGWRRAKHKTYRPLDDQWFILSTSKAFAYLRVTKKDRTFIQIDVWTQRKLLHRCKWAISHPITLYTERLKHTYVLYSKGCPERWIEYKGTEYKFMREALNISKAMVGVNQTINRNDIIEKNAYFHMLL